MAANETEKDDGFFWLWWLTIHIGKKYQENPVTILIRNDKDVF